jgi:hypothetical protein
LDQDPGTNFCWVGWWWEIADLPLLIVNGFDNNKIVPIDLKESMNKVLPLLHFLLAIQYSFLKIGLILTKLTEATTVHLELDGVF